jgi:hypothetical protein
MIMLYDKIQIRCDLKLRAKPLHRAPVVAPPSFSAHKDLWTEISITLALRTIGNHWEPLIENPCTSCYPPKISLAQLRP